MDMNLGKLQDMVGDREALACCSLWGRKESDTTWWMNNNNKSSLWTENQEDKKGMQWRGWSVFDVWPLQITLLPCWLYLWATKLRRLMGDFPSVSLVKNLPGNAEDTGSVSDLRRSHMPWGNEAHLPQLLSLWSRV